MMKTKQLICTALIFIGVFQTKVADAQNFKEWAKTPPMGWNSYDCYGATVTEQEIKDNAKMMEVHLKEFGWQYVVVDYCWFFPYPGAMNNPAQTSGFKPGLPMDANGRLLPALDRFPTSANNLGFKPLADYVHGLGLKFGIHVMRGIPREAVAKKLPVLGTKFTADQIANVNDTCKWLNTMYGVDMTKPGAQEYYNSLFELYASWGVDFVKVDDIASPYHYEEIEAVRKAIDNCKRPMVLSLSPGDFIVDKQAEHVNSNANMWRISSDFWDNWHSLYNQFELCHNWESYIGQGNWPDADMIPIGLLSRRGPNGEQRRSLYSENEKTTLMTLFSIFRSPLMYGGDLTMIKNPERKLLTNKAVLEVNQNSKNNRQLFRHVDQIAWIADVPGSTDKYLAVFYLGDYPTEEISVTLSELGLKEQCQVVDLWANKEVGTFKTVFKISIPNHGAGLFRISNL